MVTIDSSEVWKQIPPEEKIELMSRAHAHGVFSAICLVGVGCTIAMALHIPALVWISLIFCPLIFQLGAGRAWRGLRPRVMLEYLAARSAARRFAFTEGAKDLQLSLMFRGNLQLLPSKELAEQSIEAAGAQLEEVAVWVALFRDTVVMLTERPGGATLTFGHTLDDRLKCESSGKGGYSNDKAIIIAALHRNTGVEHRYKLTSKYPAALIVFEKRVAQLTAEIKQAYQKMLANVEEETAVSQTSDSLFS